MPYTVYFAIILDERIKTAVSGAYTQFGILACEKGSLELLPAQSKIKLKTWVLSLPPFETT